MIRLGWGGLIMKLKRSKKAQIQVWMIEGSGHEAGREHPILGHFAKFDYESDHPIIIKSTNEKRLLFRFNNTILKDFIH